ncbi:MAG: glycolate oxidase subunit GlcE [Burkholderiales bacterium]|nr:glycolate oxidase subunit GlcE [Burkholderiales bacterium]
MQDIIDQLAHAIREAASHKTCLRIRGGGTKDFYGGPLRGESLSTTAYRGVIDYEPTELVVIARAGTPLPELEAVLREKGQMLAFEPPHFGSSATLGGAIAAGLSGPRRAYAGAVRDFMLGVRMVDGKGSDLRFGGRVMKNVAGYDISRLMAGSLGTLGVILEASLKTLPLPAAEFTLRREQTQAEAIALMNEWAGKPLPLSATCHTGGFLYVRLSGAVAAVRAAREKLGGEEVTDGTTFWRELRDQRLDFFTLPEPLWRLSIKSTAAALDLPGEQIIEWGGALRWVRTIADAQTIREAAARCGGHAALFRGGDKTTGVFHPLPPVMMRLHQRLKQAFDPAGILNPGRMYEGL